MSKIIWALVGLLVGSWLVGIVFKIAEDAIHILLVVAGVLGAANLAFKRRGNSGPDPATN